MSTRKGRRQQGAMVVPPAVGSRSELPGAETPVVMRESTPTESAERPQTAAALTASEDRYRQLFFYNRAVQLLIDPATGAIVDANPAAASFYGYTTDELRHMPISAINVLPPESITQAMGRAVATQQGSFIFPHRLRSGEVREVEVHSSPVLEHGRTLLHSIIHDVTERRRAESALQESEERFRSIFVHAPIGIGVAGPDYRFRSVNPALCALVGYTEEELLSRSWVDLTHPDDLPLTLQAMEAAARGARPAYQLEKRYIRKDGGVIWVNLTVTAVYDGAGRLLYEVGLIEDITARKQAEEALRTLNMELERRVQERTAALARQTEELQRLNADLQQFAYICAHDLQEPVRMVAIYVQMLTRRLEGALDAQAKEYLQFAITGARQLHDLLDDLLIYTELETAARPQELTDCEELLERVLGDSTLQRAVASTQALVTHDPLPTVMADARQLRLVFQELLNNALMFRRTSPPQVHISAVRVGSQWRFAVRDNGIGIESWHTERIFRMFERLHPRRQYPGTGMGLAICKKVIERHGGRIWVESEVGKGSCFFFTIAASESDSAG